MTPSSRFATTFAHWASAPAASESAILALVARVPAALPDAYYSLLRHSNGGEGDLPVQPFCCCLWPAEDVVRANADYQVAEYAPGLFAFASSGGGELLAFDLRGQSPAPVVAVPCIGLSLEAALPIAPDFHVFLTMLGTLPAT